MCSLQCLIGKTYAFFNEIRVSQEVGELIAEIGHTIIEFSSLPQLLDLLVNPWFSQGEYGIDRGGDCSDEREHCPGEVH